VFHLFGYFVRHGLCSSKTWQPLLISVTIDTAAGEQPGLVVRKLQQCCVVFNFDDPLADVKSKEVKRACLNELIAALNDTRGLLTEAVCIEIVHMVSSQVSSFARHISYCVEFYYCKCCCHK